MEEEDGTDSRIDMDVEKATEELVELRRTNKELQHAKRELNFKLSAALLELENGGNAANESDELRKENEALRKQVECLQNNRFTEVEEMVYLRWVNACLRYELRSSDVKSEGKALQLNKNVSPNSQEKAKRLMLKYAGTDLLALRAREEQLESGYESADSSAPPRPAKLGRGLRTSLIKRFKSWRKSKDQSDVSEPETPSPSPCRRMSFAVDNIDYTPNTQQSTPEALNSIAASFQIMSRTVGTSEVADKYPPFKDRHKLAPRKDMEKFANQKDAAAAVPFSNEELPPDFKRRAPRTANPPPKSFSSGPVPKVAVSTTSQTTPPPPPPPPPPLFGKKSKAKAAAVQDEFRRAPEVIAFYQSFMKRDGKKDAQISPGGKKDTQLSPGGNIADARNNMIGEIANRSSHLLAIKADVETQGDFVRSLAAEVRAAVFTDVEDVVSFVRWLDDELSFLVDERAVLKHFDWPEAKADALRECAFQYQDLKKLEQSILSSQDYSSLARDAAMKAMQASLEKIERSIYAVLRTRDSCIARYKDFNVPTSWMLDSGLIGKIKQASVKLAQHYMKRVVKELDFVKGKEPVREFLLLQGVRFAFRVHQFAGGFDRESMRAFEQLRECAH